MKALTPDQHALLSKLSELVEQGVLANYSQLGSLLGRRPTVVAKQMRALYSKGLISSPSFPLAITVGSAPTVRPLRRKAATWADAHLPESYKDGVYQARRRYARGDVYADSSGATVVLYERKGPRKIRRDRSAYYWVALSETTWRKRDLTEIALDVRFSKVR